MQQEAQGITLKMPTPRAFMPLLEPCRFKGASGGRGAAKSHFIAECMIESCVLAHSRIACLREYQTAIKESVKQLLEDKIQHYGLGSMFRVTEAEIAGPNESLIIFKGLQSHTAESIKSLEAFNRAWVEEAQTISQRSLDILLPTFRAEGSQLWFSWNPRDPSDPIDRFFRQNKDDPDFRWVKVTYANNPWFPNDLRRDMERDRRRDPDKYAHIWLGAYQRLSEARVFRNWRIAEFPDPPQDTRFHYGADWGFSIDPTVLVRCFIQERTLYVDHEAYAVGCEIDRTPELFEKVPGARRWPIRADSARPETISYMQRAGFRISPAVKGKNSVEDGIEFLKSYDIIVHPRCRHVSDELSSYSYKTDRLTNEVLPILEDAANHTIDALRYALEGQRLVRGPFRITPKILEQARHPRHLPRYIAAAPTRSRLPFFKAR